MDKLDTYTKNYDYKNGVMGIATNYCARIFERHMSGKSILELGPAEGVMTEFFYPKYGDYTVVEGASYFCKQLRDRFPAIKVVNSYFEKFNPSRQYDNIILGHVLEHVDDPVQILKLCKTWLSGGGGVYFRLFRIPIAYIGRRQ